MSTKLPAQPLSQPFGLHWFRRDLHLNGNSSLAHNVKRFGGSTLGLFILDPDLPKRADFSPNRFYFLLQTLQDLKANLRERGGDLLVVEGRPAEVFRTLVNSLAPTRPQLVTYAREFEPHLLKREHEVLSTLKKLQVPTESFRDHLLLEPGEITKDDGSYYKVYSPFARRWFARVHGAEVQGRIADADLKLKFDFQTQWSSVRGKSFALKDRLDEALASNARRVTIPLPPAGERAALRQTLKFRKPMTDYLDARNFPSESGTSRLSVYLKHGSLAPAQVLKRLGVDRPHFRAPGGATQFVKELAWREFYQHILFYRPDVERTTFVSRYADLKWSKSRSAFTRWCEGTTGFPIVDAAMRQLQTTGWMHNRMRMVVSSFFVKDLLLDYRQGEMFFMRHLLDGDLASNNGGWQWAASTGVDPQPYFRIFNPWLQAKKFDPDGVYIRRYVPELEGLPAKLLHAPDGDRSRRGYPKPMVSHDRQKVKALALYRNVLGKSFPPGAGELHGGPS